MRLPNVMGPRIKTYIPWHIFGVSGKEAAFLFSYIELQLSREDNPGLFFFFLRDLPYGALITIGFREVK